MSGLNGSAIKDFVHSPTNADPVLRALIDIQSALTKAWSNNQCLDCPIGELAALAGAIRTWYEETH